MSVPKVIGDSAVAWLVLSVTTINFHPQSWTTFPVGWQNAHEQSDKRVLQGVSLDRGTFIVTSKVLKGKTKGLKYCFL